MSQVSKMEHFVTSLWKDTVRKRSQQSRGQRSRGLQEELGIVGAYKIVCVVRR